MQDAPAGLQRDRFIGELQRALDVLFHHQHRHTLFVGEAGRTDLPDPKKRMTWNELLDKATKLTLDANGKKPGESGFDPTRIQQYGFAPAFRHSLDDNWRATKATITFLPRLVTNSGRKEVSGVIGITDASQQVVSVSFTWYLRILGLVSLSLAIMNLLPLLPLDGGHILFSIIEGLRRRAVGREVYERVSAVGIALFLVLMFIGLSNDINRLGGG